MGVLAMMKIFILFLVVSATVLATSSDAAQRARFVTVWPVQEGQPMYEEIIPTDSTHGEEAREEKVKRLHERMLRMNTHDYGTYDTTPSLSKPRSKLIPN